jgi:ASC-1-like (ASCH) protein
MTVRIVSVQEPWFTAIKTKNKTVEGRLNKGKFAEFKVGDFIIFKNDNKQVKTKIKYIHNYNSFKSYLETEGINKCLPGINTIDEGVKVYRKFYSKDDEKTYKIVAIGILLIQSNGKRIIKSEN